MREDRKKVRDPEGSEKRDGRRSLAVRDVGLIRHARNGDLDSIKQMIKEGANINEQDETGWTVLHEACVRNLPRIVDYLLRHGANSGLANVNGDTALHCAARVGCLRIVRALLYYNADPILSNHKGEKPLDLCHDSEVSSFLKQ
ncbi:Ankyrin repeat domain-containing protein, partial [Schistosoma japonicum]